MKLSKAIENLKKKISQKEMDDAVREDIDAPCTCCGEPACFGPGDLCDPYYDDYYNDEYSKW